MMIFGLCDFFLLCIQEFKYVRMYVNGTHKSWYRLGMYTRTFNFIPFPSKSDFISAIMNKAMNPKCFRNDDIHIKSN